MKFEIHTKKSYDNAGMTFTLKKQDDLIHMYESETIPPKYELVLYSLQKKDECLPGGGVVEKGYRFPKSSLWGAKGFSYKQESRAEQKWEELIAEKKHERQEYD